MFPGTIFEKFYRKLARQSGVPDLPFGRAERLDNSGMALASFLFARETAPATVVDRFHDALFRAHFVEEQNISQVKTVLAIATACGLDAPGLETSLQTRKYFRELDDCGNEARQKGINSVPTFIVNGRHRLVGTQPLEGFREFLQKING
jgi:predicted DsbA family dithiol-disulfide isomerase